MSRRAPWLVPVLVVVLVITVGFGWQAAIAQERTAPRLADLCSRYESMVASLMLNSPASQAARAQRAEALAALAIRFPNVPQPQADSVPLAGQRLRAVVGRPYVSVADLYASARPIAVACGVDFRTGWNRNDVGNPSNG